MRTISFNVYQIEEHPNKTKCFEWIRNNWHDLNQHTVDEVINSLKKLQEIVGGDLKYSISQVPDRGEFISFRDYDHEKLCHLSSEDCSLTGYCWDIDVITHLRQDNINYLLKIIHSSTEYCYSDEGLENLCMANDYEFNENGKFIS
jgi:hypothetical protein